MPSVQIGVFLLPLPPLSPHHRSCDLGGFHIDSPQLTFTSSLFLLHLAQLGKEELHKKGKQQACFFI